MHLSRIRDLPILFPKVYLGKAIYIYGEKDIILHSFLKETVLFTLGISTHSLLSTKNNVDEKYAIIKNIYIYKMK